MQPNHQATLVTKTDTYVVIDNVLPEELWEKMLNSVNHESYYPAHVVGQFSRTWRYAGQMPASSNSYLRSRGPFTNYAQVMFEVAERLAQQMCDFVKPDSWNDIRVHSHVCTQGTKLHWHLDNHGVCSLTYWVHKRWDCNWGGELMIPSVEPTLVKPKMTFTNDYENEHLKNGTGIYITPKPNRCVLTGPGVWHGVNRVDPDAGDNVRVSVVTFLV